MRLSWVARCIGAGVLLSLVACGGGGGGGSDPGTPPADGPRAPLPTVQRDDNPTAARLSVGPDDYLPTGSSQATFDRLNANGNRVGSTTLSMVWQGRDRLQFTEADDGGPAQLADMERTAAGWMQSSIPGNQLPPAVNAAIGSLLLLPSPFHAIGTTRVQYRSGNYGVDLDGDGVHESFEFEFRQTMVGEETLALPGGSVTALHIRDVLLLTVVPSRRDQPNLRATATSDTWLAKGLGYVREQVSSVGSEGRDVFPPYTLALASLRIDGVDPLDAAAVRDVHSIALVHRDLVYDTARRAYYASVPGSVVGQGNRLARIDADTGAVTYSAVVGSDPGAMALAADGASLYVGLDGSSEVVRLALPGMTELSRTRLPLHPQLGGLLYAQSLAASPTAPGVVAVALATPNVSPVHAGVALLRDGVLQPVQTAWHTGSNKLVFGADGNSLFGINTESTEFGLRRMAVQADGVVVEQTLSNAFGRFYVPSIDRAGNRLVLSNRIYAADTLAPLGQVADSGDCRVLTASRLVCVAGISSGAAGLLLVDAATSVITSRLTVPGVPASDTLWLVAGPSGQLAVRDQVSHPAGRDAGRVRLVRHPDLP